MRKRSCVLPVWFTVLAFSSPAFYVLFRFNKPGIFSLGELGGKVVGAAGCSVIIWLFYGVFCLVAPAQKGHADPNETSAPTPPLTPPPLPPTQPETEAGQPADTALPESAAPVSDEKYMPLDVSEEPDRRSLVTDGVKHQLGKGGSCQRRNPTAEKPSAPPSPAADQEDAPRARGRASTWLGWTLFLLGVILFLGDLQSSQGYPRLGSTPNVGGWLGLNVFSLPACLLAFYAGILRKNGSGRLLFVCSSLLLAASTVLFLRPADPQSPRENAQSLPSESTGSAGRLARAREEFATAKADLIRAVQNDLKESGSGLRARIPQSAPTHTTPNDVSRLPSHESTVPSSLPPRDSRFALITLPLGVRIEVPKNWRLLDADLNTTIEAGGEAATKLAGIAMPRGQKVNLFRANSNPPTTYAGIAINASDSEMSPADVMAASDAEIAELGSVIRQMFEQVFAKQNWQMIRFDPVRREMVDGHPSLVIEYVRSGPRGAVVVQMTRLLIGDKEISLNLSYRQSEAGLWKPIVAYMRSTFHVSPLSRAD